MKDSTVSRPFFYFILNCLQQCRCPYMPYISVFNFSSWIPETAVSQGKDIHMSSFSCPMLPCCCPCRFCFTVSIYLSGHTERVDWGFATFPSTAILANVCLSNLGPISGVMAVNSFPGASPASGTTFVLRPRPVVLAGVPMPNFAEPDQPDLSPFPSPQPCLIPLTILGTAGLCWVGEGPACPITAARGVSPACAGQCSGVPGLRLRSASGLIFLLMFCKFYFVFPHWDSWYHSR